MYKIGDFARLTQIPVKTLRYYDEIDLLSPAYVDPTTGYRCYTAEQLQRINRILVLKDLGFSLREIRELLAENVRAAELRDLLLLKHEELSQRVERETARLARASARLQLIEHDVAVRNTAPQLVASVRDTVATHDESERLFEELAHHYGPIDRGRRAVVWHACAEDEVDCEALILLSPPSPSPSRGRVRVRVYELPAQWVASLVYRGDHDFMPAYRAMHAWIAAGGAKVAGPKRELYLEEGGPDAESLTELQFPIAV